MLAKQIKWWDLSKIGGHKLKTIIRAAIRSAILFLGVLLIAQAIQIHEHSVLFVIVGSALLGVYSGTAN